MFAALLQLMFSEQRNHWAARDVNSCKVGHEHYKKWKKRLCCFRISSNSKVFVTARVILSAVTLISVHVIWWLKSSAGIKASAIFRVSVSREGVSRKDRVQWLESGLDDGTVIVKCYSFCFFSLPHQTRHGNRCKCVSYDAAGFFALIRSHEGRSHTSVSVFLHSSHFHSPSFSSNFDVSAQVEKKTCFRAKLSSSLCCC